MGRPWEPPRTAFAAACQPRIAPSSASRIERRVPCPGPRRARRPEHGGEGGPLPALGVELPLVDLGEVKEQLRLSCTGFANELPRAGEKIVIVHDGDCRICID